MKPKKNLSKILLAAMTLAAGSSGSVQATEFDGIFLAKGGCGSGCAAATPSTPEANSEDKSKDTYNTGSGTYKPSNGTSGTQNSSGQKNPSGSNSSSGTNSSSGEPTGMTTTAYQDNGQNGNNRLIGYNQAYDTPARTGHTAEMNAGANYDARMQNDRSFYLSGDPYAQHSRYADPSGYGYREDVYGNASYPYGAEYGGSIDMNRVQPVSERVSEREIRYGQTGNVSINTSGTVTEAQLLEPGVLTPQARSVYQNLNSQGKGLALQIVGQNPTMDKNAAVMEAARAIKAGPGNMSR